MTHSQDNENHRDHHNSGNQTTSSIENITQGAAVIGDHATVHIENKSSRKYLGLNGVIGFCVALGMLFVTGVAVYVVWLIVSDQDNALHDDKTFTLQHALGQAFHRPTDVIELNLPSAEGRYPGAVLLSPQEGQVLPMFKAYRPTDEPTATQLEVTVPQTDAQQLLARLFSPISSSAVSQTGFSVDDPLSEFSPLLEVKLTLDELRLFEANLNSEFKRSLLENESVVNAEKNGLLPRTIVRTYEGIVSYKIQPKPSLAKPQWRSLQQTLLSIGGALTQQGHILLKSQQPAVIAYETVLVKYITSNLNGAPTDVEFQQLLAPLPKPDTLPPLLDLRAFNKHVSATQTQFLALGNERYASPDFGNLGMIQPSLALVKHTLSGLNAKPIPIDSLTSALPPILTEEQLFRAIDETTQQLTLTPPDLFLMYYSGHAVAGRGGQLMLVMSDYQGRLENDLGEDLLLGFPRAALEEPSHPFNGSNIGDLLDVMVALQAEHPEAIPGLVPISEIAKRFEATGVPFIILVDACYEHEQMDVLREQYNLTESGDYYGPQDFGGAESSQRFTKAIKQFAAAPYLRSTNPIIISSTPGTIALQTLSPLQPIWSRPEYVAPLAKRLYYRYESALADQDATSWGLFLNWMVDVKPIGEQRIRGTFSWSDYDELYRKPLLEAL